MAAGPEHPGRRGWAERLLGGTASRTAPAAPRPTARAPRSLRLAALLVGVEAVGLVGVAGTVLWLTLSGSPDSTGRALAEVVYVLLGAAALGAGAVGLGRVAGWARGPVVVLQLLLGLLGWSTLSGGRPLLGVPLLACVAGVLWFLATPESRLAYSER